MSLFVVQASLVVALRGSTRTRPCVLSGENASAASSCWVGGESKSPGVRSRVLPSATVGDEDVMADVLAPLVPVTIEQPGQPVDLDRVLLRLLGLLPVARLVRAAPGRRLRRTRSASVGGPDEAAAARRRAGQSPSSRCRHRRRRRRPAWPRRGWPETRSACRPATSGACSRSCSPSISAFGSPDPSAGTAEDVGVAPPRLAIGRRAERRGPSFRRARAADRRSAARRSGPRPSWPAAAPVRRWP